MAPSASRRASRAHPQATRPTRTARTTRAKPAFSYAESDSESNGASDSDSNSSVDEGNGSDLEIDRAPRPRPTRSQTSAKSRAVGNGKRARPVTSKSYHSPPKAKKHKSKPSSPKSADIFEPIFSSGIIPKWQSLPYHVLAQVFRYATYPLYDEHTFQPLPSGRWLLNVARLCHGFAEPAFTVLYTTPPLVPMVQAHRLVELLKADPRSMTYKYRQKVESLHIEIVQTAAYSLSGSGLLDLHGLIKDLPRLTDLEFYHQFDMAPYRSLDLKIKWTYPEAVFDALEYIDPTADPLRGDKTSVCGLRSWRWSSRLAGTTWSLDKIPQIHLKPSFASLRKVAFVNYQIPHWKKDEEDPKHENILATALSNLKYLDHLVFECSTLVNNKLLPMLPKTLRNLELINCWEIVAEDFAPFLLTHGSQLRCLTLNHNQSLSLSFLPILGEACPKLQVLRMNLTYFALHATYHDSEPQYKQLLLPTEVPVWPSTLQTIELIQMRKWETEAAEMFFQSLLDAAGNLPDLRKLSIQAILNIGWRDRASFRDKWVGSLARVFKRVSNSPKIHRTIKPVKSEASTVQVVIPKKAVERFPSLPRDDSKAEGNHGEASTNLPIRKSPRSSSTINNSFSETSQPSNETSKSSQRKNRIRMSDISTSSLDQETDSTSHSKTRRSTRQQAKVTYTESDDGAEQSDVSVSSVAEKKPSQSKPSRELKLLKDTVGFHGSFAIPTAVPESVSPVEEDGVNKGKGRADEVIQGMCEIVEIRIDNLRPTENQVTEADFLDEEQSGDDDWNGDQDEEEVWG